jgi:hypothetical protein
LRFSYLNLVQGVTIFTCSKGVSHFTSLFSTLFSTLFSNHSI